MIHHCFSGIIIKAIGCGDHIVKRFRVMAVILSCCLLLAACATQQYYGAAVNSWQGANQEAIYHVWGYPNQIKRLPNGHQLLVYHFRERGRNPVYHTPGSTRVVQNKEGATQVMTTGPSVSGGGTYDLRCTTWFELGSNGRVTNTSFRGNDCVATKNFMMMHTYQG